MEVHFSLPIGSYSVNSMYYGNKRHGKRPDAVDWERTVLHHISDPEIESKLAEFRNKYDPKIHCIEIEAIFYYPKEVFFNKSGTISSRKHDLTNIEKPLQDLLFDKKYYDLPSPAGAKNLNLNDKVVLDFISRQRIADKHYIDITIKLNKIENIIILDQEESSESPCGHDQ